MNESTLVWASVALGLFLFLVTVVLVAYYPRVWWLVAIGDTVAMVVGWSIMAASRRDVVDANLWPVGAVFLAIVTLPVSFGAARAIVAIRHGAGRDRAEASRQPVVVGGSQRAHPQPREQAPAHRSVTAERADMAAARHSAIGVAGLACGVIGLAVSFVGVFSGPSSPAVAAGAAGFLLCIVALVLGFLEVGRARRRAVATMRYGVAAVVLGALPFAEWPVLVGLSMIGAAPG